MNTPEDIHPVESLPDEEISNTNPNNENNVFTVEEAYKEAGGFGLFQWIYCTITSLIFVPAGIFIYNQSFFTLKQVMMCPNPDGGSWLCEEGDRSIDPGDGDQLIDGAYPDFGNEKSLHNWITELDLFGVAPFRVSLFGALYFAGILVGMVILAFTSKFGRKINLIVSSWAIVLVIIQIVVVSNLYARYVGMFLLGVGMIQKITTYIVATEIAPFKNQIAIATVLLSFDNISFPLSSIYFKFISDDWRIIGYVAIGVSFLGAIGSLFCPESPRFLVDKGDYDKARVIINKMSETNKSSLHKKHWKFEEERKISKNSTKGGGKN